MWTVTLTFDLATWFLHATHRLVMIISAKYFSNPTNFQMKLWVGHGSEMHKLKVLAVTLTFDLATWFIHVAHCLVLISFVPNNFQIPPRMMKLWVGHDSGTHK